MSLSLAEVSKYQTRAIYVVGAPCTGKTTLVHALASHLQPRNTQVITEVARKVFQESNILTSEIRSSPARSFELQRLILEAQLRAETEASRSASPSSLSYSSSDHQSDIEDTILISDRSGIDPIVFASKYGPPGSLKLLLESDAWDILRPRMQNSLVIVCEPVQEWFKDDGVRLMPEQGDQGWVGLHREFCEMLEEEGVPYVTLPGSVRKIEDRVTFVMSEFKSSAVSEPAALSVGGF
ncbi:hypothetical protein FQN54_002618 [Arachnomyces sp. PD_36]|nr:hypothetical protein FQN54_002618 [Arachnomyces sp. PD_36]